MKELVEYWKRFEVNPWIQKTSTLLDLESIYDTLLFPIQLVQILSKHYQLVLSHLSLDDQNIFPQINEIMIWIKSWRLHINFLIHFLSVSKYEIS